MPIALAPTSPIKMPLTTFGSGELATDIFTYTISDDTDNAKAELTITITGVNDAPIIFDATTRRKYIEGSGSSMVIDTSLLSIDADHLTISSASVVISSAISPQKISLGDDVGGPSRPHGIQPMAPSISLDQQPLRITSAPLNPSPTKTPTCSTPAQQSAPSHGPSTTASPTPMSLSPSST